ncbi:MAG TPA: hypothetical protein DCR87_05525 [Acidobacteria bacterium]|nr:hypothetical protein [Acidobacteriota bacterium]
MDLVRFPGLRSVLVFGRAGTEYDLLRLNTFSDPPDEAEFKENKPWPTALLMVSLLFSAYLQ